jgi:hypothetical protein
MASKHAELPDVANLTLDDGNRPIVRDDVLDDAILKA